MSKHLSRYALIIYWIVMFIATHIPELDRYKPATGWPPLFEEISHVGVYAGWTAMWWWVLLTHGRLFIGSAVTWIIIGGAAYGAFDELTQGLVARTPTLPDFASNIVGILLAIIVLQAIDRYVLKRRAAE